MTENVLPIGKNIKIIREARVFYIEKKDSPIVLISEDTALKICEFFKAHIDLESNSVDEHE